MDRAATVTRNIRRILTDLDDRREQDRAIEALLRDEFLDIQRQARADHPPAD